MKIYERLLADHKEQRQLANSLMDTSGDSPERRSLFKKFKIELEAHAAAEEQTLYSTLIGIPEGQEEARHSIAEHQTITNLIATLEDTAMDTGAWLQNFGKLKHAVLHHLEEEEGGIFQLAKKLIADDVAQWLTTDFDERKSAELKNLDSD